MMDVLDKIWFAEEQSDSDLLWRSKFAISPSHSQKTNDIMPWWKGSTPCNMSATGVKVGKASPDCTVKEI